MRSPLGPHQNGLRVGIAWAPQNYKHSVFFVYFVATKIRKLILGFITTNGAYTKR